MSDGTHEVTTSKLITVVDSSAREPHAEITPNKDDNCDGDSPPNGDFVMIWVCEDNEIDDRQVSVSVTVYWTARSLGQDVIPMSQIATQRSISSVTNGTSTGTRILTETACRKQRC